MELADRNDLSVPNSRFSKLRSLGPTLLCQRLKRLFDLVPKAVVFTITFFFVLAGPAFAQTDLSIGITDVGQDGLPAGSTIVYGVEITNAGFNDSVATTIDFDVAPGTTLTSGGAGLTCQNLPAAGAATVTCDIPPIIAGTSVTFSPEVLSSQAGSFDFAGTLSPDGDTDTSNNSASETTTLLAGADIEVVATGPDIAAAGSFIDYSFDLINNGPNDSNGFDFTFTIPEGLANVTPPAGCTASGDTFICSIPGTFANQETLNLTFNGQIAVASGSSLVAVGSVSGGSPADGDAENDLQTVSTTVTGGSDVALTKTVADNDEPLLVGDTTTFTLSPSYSGDVPTGLTLNDTIPANYQVTSITIPSNTWDCDGSTGNQVSCILASGTTAGDDVPLGDVIVEVTILSSGAPTNTATVAANGPIDPNPDNNVANDGGTDIQDPFVDHQANKTGPSPSLVAVGSDYDFRLSSTNLGNADFFGTIVITDQIPAALTFNSINGNGFVCDPSVPPAIDGPATVTCSFTYDQTTGPLSPGEQTPQIVTNVIVNDTGPISNTVVVSTQNANIEEDPSVLGNNTITVGVTGQSSDVSTDIAINKTAGSPSPDAVLSGELQTFVLEILNNGPMVAGGTPVDSLNVVVTDVFRDLIDSQVGPNNGFVSFVIDEGTATGFTCGTAAAGGLGQSLTCNIDVLPECTPGSCPTVTVTVRPGGDGETRTNVANILSQTTADTDPSNNRATANYTIDDQTDVTVDKSVTPSTAVVGQNVVYVITAENRPTNADGDPILLSTAENVEIIDTLPDNVTFISAVPSSGSCTTPAVNTTTSGGALVSCDLGDIPNNAQQTVTITVRPNNITLENPSLTIFNTVDVSTDTTETDPDNNTADVTANIEEPSFDLVPNKSASASLVAVNEDFTYFVVANNFGPSTAENVVLTDTMPASGVAFRSVSSSDPSVMCTTSGGSPGVNITDALVGVTVECTIPFVVPGNPVTIEILAVGDETGSFLNNASIIADLSDQFENTDNNTASFNTTVRSRVDLRVNSKTPSAPEFNIGEDFEWVINIENVDDASQFFGVAEDVVLADNLPNNMVLAGAPTFLGETCSGAAGDTSFSCAIGTMAIGEIIDITVPVRVIAATSEPQTFENSAAISTSSLDANSDNDTNSGTVDINSSSISGTIFRDFNDDGTRDGTDTDVGGVELTLTGTDLNGDPITPVTVTTNPDGSYTFPFLPEGNYAITRADVNEDFVVDGQNRAGTSGPLGTGTVISGIALGPDADAPGFDFAIVPQARIGLAKAAGTPTPRADGTFDVPFTFVVENFSLEELNSITVDDQLAGTPDLFGTFTAAATDMPRGTYTIVAAPFSSCGGAIAGFTGDATTVELINGGVIAAGATCDITVTVRISPTDPLPTGTPQYLNSATIDGVGTLSGQTVNDTSTNGGNADPGNNDTAGDAGEDVPTPVTLDFDPQNVQLEKTVDTTALSNPPLPGDLLTFTYTVSNPTDFNIFDVTVVENAPGPQATNSPPNFSGTGSPPVVGPPAGGTDLDADGDLPDLAPGGTITYMATYSITQDDIDAGEVLNTATVTATDVFGDPLTDFSDDPSLTGGDDFNGDGVPDDPTVALLPRVASLDVAKSITAQSFSEPLLQAGDTIDYEFVVTNTGNTNITAVTPVDPGPTFGGIAGTGAALVFATTDPTDLAPTDVATYTASYTLTAADIENFFAAANQSIAIANTAAPSGTQPDGVDLVTNTADASTGVTPQPDIVLTKAITDVIDANGNGILGDAEDTITYDLVVTNTGNTSLANIVIDDAVLGLAGVPLTAPSAAANLAPGDSGSISDLVFTIRPVDVAAGSVVNTAQVSGTPVATNPDGTPNAGTTLVDAGDAPLDDVDDTSDTLTDPVSGSPAQVEPSSDPVGTGDDNPTVLILPTVGADITITKRIDTVTDTNGNGTIGDVGDVISYTLMVTNTGTTALADILVEDALLDLSQNVGNLAIGTSTTVSGLDYVITLADQSRGDVENSANVSGDPVATGTDGNPDPNNPLVDETGADLPDLTDISDTLSDPNLDADGNVVDVDPNANGTFDDPTFLILPVAGPRIEITKAIADVIDANNNGVLGDTGDTIVYDLTVTNTGNSSLADVTVSDALLELVDVPANPQSLLPGDSGTVVGVTHTITLAEQGAGRVENTAATMGQPVVTDPVTGLPDPNQPIQDVDGNDIAPVTDTSDTRTDPDLDADGNVITTADPNADGDDDAPTILNLPVIAPELELTKAITDVIDTNSNGLFGDVGDQIVYDFEVTNTGNTSLSNVTISDAKLGLVDVPVVAPDLAPLDVAVLTGQTVTITAADLGAGEVVNTATTQGTPVATLPDGTPDTATPLVDADGAPLAPVEDISDTRTDPDLDADGNVITTADPNADGDDDAPTILNLPVIAPELALTKAITDVIDANNNGLFGDVGDQIVYDFEVTNTGNTSLSNVTISDAKLGLVDVPVVAPDLAPLDVAVLTGQTYTITTADQGAGEVVNTATTQGTPVATLTDGTPDTATPLVDADGAPLAPVTDTSDTRTDPDLDADGNVITTADPNADGDDDAPTILNLPVIAPELALTKAITDVIDANNNGLFGDVGDQIVYDFEVTNPGNTSLSNITISDPVLGLVDVPVVAPDLAPLDVAVLTGQTYTITAADQGAGEVVNTATTQGTPVATLPDGTPDTATPLVDADGAPLAPVTDTSDTRTDPDLDADGNVITTADPNADGDDDAPTILNLPVLVPGITLVKSVVDVKDTNNDLVVGNAGDTINYLFVIANSGDTALTAVSVTDPLLGITAEPATPTALLPGETASLTGSLVITPEFLGDGFVENTATTDGTAVATGPDGLPDPTQVLVDAAGTPLDPVSDVSDTGSEPEALEDGSIVPVDDPANEGTPDDPTVLFIPLVPSNLVISGTVFLDNNRDGVLNGTDDPTEGVGFTVSLLDEDGNIVFTTTTDANGDYEITGFPIGIYTVTFSDPDGEQVGELGPFTFSEDVQEIRNVDFPISGAPPIGELTLTKTASLENVVLGQTVSYEIVASNVSSSDFSPATITDELPNGLGFIPGTAAVDGVPATPIVSGSVLTFEDLILPTGGSVRVTLQVRVLADAPTGEMTNNANLLDGLTGQVIAPTATATVYRTAEAVFDCSDIIGKVFDDRNFDGYQNGLDRGAITDQVFGDGKGPVTVPEGSEPGLPHVRLVTPTGTIITTDEYGRYSVPCAELPGVYGANFTLKLDERSLPTGYRVTTENPRSMRVTAGIMTEMNFGAAIGRVIDIDLTAAAFDADNEPVDRLEQGILRVLQQVASDPSILRISYFSAGEDRADINDRLDELEDLINARWRGIGEYRLIVERDVKYLQ